MEKIAFAGDDQLANAAAGGRGATWLTLPKRTVGPLDRIERC